jgi:hypothetical protein
MAIQMITITLTMQISSFMIVIKPQVKCALRWFMAYPQNKKIFTVDINSGASVEQAILASGVLILFTEIDLTVNKVGIWNRVVKLSEVLNDLDRIEIYRPLLADPKEVRKRRAEKAKLEGRADKTTGGRVNPLRVDPKSEI